MPELPIRPDSFQFQFPLNFDTSTMNLQSIESVPNFQLQMLQNYQAPEIQTPNPKEREMPNFAPNIQQNTSKENQKPNFVPNFASNFHQNTPKENQLLKFGPKKNSNFIAKQISLKKPVPPGMVSEI